MADRTRIIPGSVDTHCHLVPLKEEGFDVEAELPNWFAAGMHRIIDVGLCPDDLQHRRETLGEEAILFTSGIHPSQIERPDLGTQMELLISQVDNGLPIAVGEIGLDYHWDTGERTAAIRVFERQVEIATGAGLPVIVHNRNADDDVLAVLRNARPRGVMHCFSQDPAFCHACLDLGMHISFGGNITFKRSESIVESARIVPDDRLLVETDSPYLSPEPVRGRPNHPGHLGFTIERLAQIRGTTLDAVRRATTDNAVGLFGMPDA